MSLHRFPRKESKRGRWLEALDLVEEDLKDFHRVCSRHFPDGDATKDPQLNLGKRFASPKKRWTSRAKRAQKRTRLFNQRPESSSSCSVTPASQKENGSEASESVTPPVMVARIGEQLDTSFQVHELPTDDSISVSSASASTLSPFSSVSKGNSNSDTSVLVSKALLSRIEYLEAKNKSLKSKKSPTVGNAPFRVECIANDDKLIKLYTGFTTYSVFVAFFSFLGPSVNELTYWGDKESTGVRHRQRKLSPFNQFFMTLIKLKLNLRNKDIAYCFGISEPTISRYLTTWVCFLYQQLKEINWMPDVAQVVDTLPTSFRDKYQTTYAIIDATEIFLETPSDLHLQSSTWSSYKSHNTGKILIGCTPNGAISFISPMYVGSVSDVELTHVCGFLEKLEGKSGISVMTDRGFTIKDMLSDIGVELNIPPFLEGRPQLPQDDIRKTRHIASLRIHVERAIGRIKKFAILQGNFPLSMSRLANQIVCVCAWLTNFHPALLPPPIANSETDVEDYFQSLPSDSEMSKTDSDICESDMEL